MANLFCSFYEQIVTNIRSEIHSRAGKLNIRPANSETVLSYFRNVTMEDLDTAITTSSTSICLLYDFQFFAAVQLKLHLENEKLNRALRSTETSPLKTTKEIVTHLDRDNLVKVLGLNLSAAFDTIDFDILDENLVKRFSIKETCKKRILSYIENRKQLIQIRMTMSRKSDVLYGLPQGSILGTLIFKMYRTPIGDFLRLLMLPYQLNADDTLLYISIDKILSNASFYLHI